MTMASFLKKEFENFRKKLFSQFEPIQSVFFYIYNEWGGDLFEKISIQSIKKNLKLYLKNIEFSTNLTEIHFHRDYSLLDQIYQFCKNVIKSDLDEFSGEILIIRDTIDFLLAVNCQIGGQVQPRSNADKLRTYVWPKIDGNDHGTLQNYFDLV